METSLKSGETIELSIDAVAHGGDGIGRVSGEVCFVTGALPGDTIRARIYRRKPRIAWAHLLSITTPSPLRTANSICAGQACASACVWHAFSYPAQAEWKQRIVADNLKRIGGIQIEVGWMEQPEHRLGYRTRAVFHGDGKKVGYYEQRTHNVIGLEACPLNHPRLNDALKRLQAPGIRGDIHVTVNPEGDETLVYSNHPDAEISRCFPLTNTRGDSQCYQFEFDGVSIINGIFSQSSLLLNRMLRAHTDACIGSPQSLLDLYCGNGNLSLHHAHTCEVLGVDHSGPAIEAAAGTAPNNYIQGDEAAMCRALESRPWDVVILDPPRTGAAAPATALAKASANRIVYVSCDPATLARDLRIIASGGWTVTQATALDMFPHTPHVETVCVLER